MVTIATCMSLIVVLGVTADAEAATDIVVATGDTEVRVEAANDLLQISSLKSVQTGSDWMAGLTEKSPIPLVASINVEGRNLPVRWRFAGIRESRGPAPGIAFPV